MIFKTDPKEQQSHSGRNPDPCARGTGGGGGGQKKLMAAREFKTPQRAADKGKRSCRNLYRYCQVHRHCVLDIRCLSF